MMEAEKSPDLDYVNTALSKPTEESQTNNLSRPETDGTQSSVQTSNHPHICMQQPDIHDTMNDHTDDPGCFADHSHLSAEDETKTNDVKEATSEFRSSELNQSDSSIPAVSDVPRESVSPVKNSLRVEDIEIIVLPNGEVQEATVANGVFNDKNTESTALPDGNASSAEENGANLKMGNGTANHAVSQAVTEPTKIDESTPEKCDHDVGSHSPDKTEADGTAVPADEVTKGETTMAVFKRRWYILALFCLYSFSQACVWNTFGPISSTSEEAFGWTDADIALLSNWGPIAYITTGILFSWLLDVKGLRWACLISAVLTLIGTVLRCITMETPAITWLVNVGHFLNGVGGPVAMGAPPIVSAVWFPMHERATATAIGTAWNYLGVAASFLLGPYLVQSYTVLPSNATSENGTLATPEISPTDDNLLVLNVSANGSNLTYNITTPAPSPDVGRERDAIQFYMYVVAGWCGALTLLMLIYFPSKPPLPPSASSAVQREDFQKGLKHLLTRKQFWVVAVIYGVSLGVLNCWASLLNVNLSSHGITEKEAGWIGFYATVSGCTLCLVIARFADMFARIMKKFIIALYFAALVIFIIFALACVKVIPPTVAIFYVTIICGLAAMNSAVPLIFELACELAYPTGEGTTNVVLTTINNIGGLVFLFTGMIPNIGSLWMNYTVVGAIAVCVPMWILLKENYNRLAVDEIRPDLSITNTEIIVQPDKELKPVAENGLK